MTSHTRRREPAPADPFKQWIPADKYPLDYDADRRRNRSATLPAPSYDQRAYPSHDARYNDPRHPSRPHRQDPHYPPAPSYSYHPSAHPPPTSKAYQHATRPSAQHSSSHHYPQPSSYHTHPSSAYLAGSSRRPAPEASDPRASRRPYDHLPSGEEVPRAPPRPSRAAHTSIQPSISAPPNQSFWNPSQEASSSRRYKDGYRDRDREQEREREKERVRERERERDKPAIEPETRYKDKARAERHRERECATDVRHQDSGRSRHHDRRKDSDTEGALYSEQRNASKASLSGREGHSSSVRDPSSGHRRHRTEDGTASTGRRHQPENTPNPITAMPSHSTSAPQPDVHQTGEPPPPAPRVMPVHLPPKVKPQRSLRDGRPSTAQGAQSGSDTERASARHRMERTPSGPAVQRSDAHTSTSTRDRGNQDLSMTTRDDVKRPEGKHGHQDTRQPFIPLVTPGFSASALPAETRTPTAPQIVSIRAGQGPSDPHDAHYKSSAVSHSDSPQEIYPPHSTSATIVKSSSHPRSQPFETRPQHDRPPAVVDPRTDPRGDDLPPGQHMSIHESSRALPTPISKPSHSRGNAETGPEVVSSSYPPSRPSSRSAHRAAGNTAPSAVAGPRPSRSISQGPPTNDPPTRPPSAVHYTVSSTPSNPTNGSSPKAGLSSSAQPSPKYAQLHGVSPSHSTAAQLPSGAPSSVHPTPTIVPQTFTTSSRPSTRDGPYTDSPYAHRQSGDQFPTTNDNPELRRSSNGTTVKATWVVQTPATAKRAKVSREDKYLRDHHFNMETPQEQLRQVLSQDDDPFPRVSSSMIKASQATTPLTSSQRSSLSAKARDVSFGTPRGIAASGSPSSGFAKETPPEHIPRQYLPPHLAGPPQIAVVGATPITPACDLPQGCVDHSLLAPSFPAPTRVSRTTSSSQDKPSRPPAVREVSSSYQPQFAPAVSLFQPYQPPSPPTPEEGGQFSPPPLPVPPPRGLEDSPPPPPIETRTSEVILTRSQSDGYPIPEVQSEMFHLPSQHSGPQQLSSIPPRATQTWQPGKADSRTVPAGTSDASAPLAHSDVRFSKPALAQPEGVQMIHQEIMKSTSVVPLLSSTPPARPRPKVTIEDVPEDIPTSSRSIPASAPAITVSESRPTQPSQHTTAGNTNSTSRSAAVDHKSSPRQDPPPHRFVDSSAIPTAPPMPPPTPALALTRAPSSAPPTQPTFPAPPQRATSYTVPSRTYQRAAEMLQTGKLSAPVGTNAGATGSGSRSTAPLVQTTYNPINTGGNSAQSASTSRPVHAPTTNGPLASTSTALSVPKVAAPTITASPVPPVGAQGPLSATQPLSALDTFKQQLSRPGPLSIPTVDTTPTTIMSTTTVKNVHQEQPVVDSARSRDAPPSATRNLPSSSHIYPTSSRTGTSSTLTQQTHVAPAQPSHYRAVSLPIATPSPAAQKPPSPRRYFQPIPSATVSTQPFPARPEPQSARVPTSGYLSTPAPVRSARPLPSDHTNDSDMLKTPSSIAPSPMLNSDNSNAAPPSLTIPTRPRKASTESKDDKKKGLFGLFRTRTLSSKATDPPATSSAPRASLDQGRTHLDPSAATPVTIPVTRGMASASAPKESRAFPPHVTSASTRAGPSSKVKGKLPDPITIPTPPAQAGRDHRDATPHIFTPFKFLHSKRNRTVSAASLDVCDGNTATNTVVGSPDHSIVSQAHPLPAIVPPDIRDPLIAASEWRDREEAARRNRKSHRIRRPGVTFDLEEEPPSPAPGTTSKRKKLIRRPSGRTPTPGPPRG